MEEIKLKYGNVNNAVKVGDTVRRDSGPWTPTIHTLLDVPKPLGIDNKGREILSYIDGDAAVRPWPPVMLTNEGIAQAGRLLRRYHDTVADFKPSVDATWRFVDHNHGSYQVILHGDLGPWNTIWHEDTLIGLIDWDFAHPGDRIEDVAQLAYYFIPLRGTLGWQNAGFEKRPHLAVRLQTLVEAYGMF
jgi:hypothetical protein